VTSSKLSRVKNHRDLIFRKGQTNIKKAIVKIIFSNLNKEKSPTGYENCDEIVIERIISVNSSKNKIRVNNRVKK